MTMDSTLLNNPNEPKKALTAQLLLAVAVLCIGVGIGGESALRNDVSPTNETVETVTRRATSYDTVTISAQSAIVMDARTGELLYAKNANQQLPLASLTKLMTALAAMAKIGGNATITIPQEALAEEGGTTLEAGERWQLADLVDQTLVASSNAGAAAIALAVGERIERATTTTPRNAFVSYMNNYAAELGLTETFFLNPTGLDEGGSLSGAYGSAADVGSLIAFITLREPRLLRATQDLRVSSRTADNVLHRAKNTNTAALRLPLLRGGKTGLTDLAGGNLAVTFDIAPDHPIVAVVLGSTESDRFTDIERLVRATLRRHSLANSSFQIPDSEK